MIPKGLTKEDKKFLIQITISNRNYLGTIKSLLLAIVIGLTAFLIALYSMLVSLGLVSQSIANIIGVIILVAMWSHWYYWHKKIVGDARRLNEQYQEYLFDVYPQLKNSKFIH